MMAKGKMKHYVPQNGVYVYERYLGDQRLLVFMNGTSGEVTITLTATRGVYKRHEQRKGFSFRKTITLGETLTLSPKEVLLLQ